MMPPGAMPGVGAIGGLGSAFQQPTTYLLTGTTRDSSGAPLGNCTVDVFDSVTREWVASVTSDPSGNYSVGVPGNDQRTFFVNSYLAGSPDVAGTTVNTLAPSPG